MRFFSFNEVSEEGGSHDSNTGDSDGSECQDPGLTVLAGPLGRDRAEKEVKGRADHSRIGQPP